MVGRAAITHPWIFRESRALLDEGSEMVPPTVEERLALCRENYRANCEARGEYLGVRVTRRHLEGYLRDVPNGMELRRALCHCESLAGCLELLGEQGNWLAAP